jgi:hypothetical protein
MARHLSRRETMSNVAENRGAAQSASAAAAGVMDKAKEAASYVGEQAKSAMHSAQDAVNSAGTLDKCGAA